MGIADETNVWVSGENVLRWRVVPNDCTAKNQLLAFWIAGQMGIASNKTNLASRIARIAKSLRIQPLPCSQRS